MKTNTERRKRKTIEEHKLNKQIRSSELLLINKGEVDNMKGLLTMYEEREQLQSLCERVLIKEQTGVYIPPDRFVLHCQKKKPRLQCDKDRDNNDTKEESVKKTTFGEGCAKENFNNKVCACCNGFIDYCMYTPFYEQPKKVEPLNLSQPNSWFYPNDSFQPGCSGITDSRVKSETVIKDEEMKQEFNEPLNLSHRFYPNDLNQPSCSGVHNLENETGVRYGGVGQLNTSYVKSETVTSGEETTTVKQVVNEHANDIHTLMDFLDDAMENFNTQHSNNTIENVRGDIDVLSSIPILPQLVNSEVDHVIDDLTTSFDDFAGYLTSNVVKQLETIDLTKYTPKRSRTIDNTKEIIEIPDEQPLKTNLKPGIVEYINLDDSDDDVVHTVDDSVIAVNDDVSVVNEKGVRKKKVRKGKKKVKDDGLLKKGMDCPICLENLKHKQIVSTICGHIFCSPCIQSVIKKTRSCPNCRKKLTTKSVHPIYLNFD